MSVFVVVEKMASSSFQLIEQFEDAIEHLNLQGARWGSGEGGGMDEPRSKSRRIKAKGKIYRGSEVGDASEMEVEAFGGGEPETQRGAGLTESGDDAFKKEMNLV